MSAHQFENFRRFKNLLRQLKSFGLNPNDWRIGRSYKAGENSEYSALRLHHREDENFILTGDLTGGNQGLFRIHSLNVTSI